MISYLIKNVPVSTNTLLSSLSPQTHHTPQNVTLIANLWRILSSWPFFLQKSRFLIRIYKSQRELGQGRESWSILWLCRRSAYPHPTLPLFSPFCPTPADTTQSYELLHTALWQEAYYSLLTDAWRSLCYLNILICAVILWTFTLKKQKTNNKAGSFWLN